MRALLFLGLGFLLWTCANVSAPTGGAKDETPPKLLSTIPKQGQTNFPGKGITLEFDEYLKLKNPKEEIIITPNIKDTKFTVKKNLVLIEFPEKLAENTTYSIAFREAIQDLNEGNPAEDLHLAFSTGDVIDSLRMFHNCCAVHRPRNTQLLFTRKTHSIYSNTSPSTSPEQTNLGALPSRT
jgi:hypothetical protein